MNEYDDEEPIRDDADERYESFVEDSMIALDEDIRDLVKKHLKGNGYYSIRDPDRFVKVIISEVLNHTGMKQQINEQGEIEVIVDKDKLFDKL